MIMQSQGSEFRARLEEMLESCGLPADVAAEIEDRLMPVTYEKGAVIFLRGAPCDLVFWLLKGFVKLYLPHEDGNRTLVDLARPGDFLGFVNDRDSKGRRHLLEAHALTKCSVGLFTRDQIALILGKLDRTGTIHLLEQLNVAWSTTFERYVCFLGSPFRIRLEMVLNGLGTRFGIDDKRGTLLVPELSHEDLAEMIGSSRPMVSKLIGDMIQEGLLARGEKRHFILRSKPSTSTVASDDIQSSVQWNGDSKRAVGARDHARRATIADAPFPPRARRSASAPYPTPKRFLQHDA
jgi:CRP/FNR family transcriptional regulator, cyclic AMP receptor protein